MKTMLLMRIMDETLKQSVGFFERIENPILALLLFCLVAAIIALWRSLLLKSKSTRELLALKDVEIKELNKALRDDELTNRELLVELKNKISQFVDTSRDHSDSIKRNNEILIQVVSKIDLTLNKLQ